MKTVSNKKMLFIAARLNSTRLPKKVLRPIFGISLLERIIERLMKDFLKEDIVVCSSTNIQDNPIEQLCFSHQIPCFRGEELDVMKRFIDASNVFNAQTIARITGDNPLTDSKMILHMFNMHEINNSQYTFNNDMPVGTRAEIIDVKTMKEIHQQLYDPANSEYMTYMLNRPDKIKTLCVPSLVKECARPEISLTVDTVKDLECMESIYEFFNGDPPNLEKIIGYLDKNPEKRLMVSEKSNGFSKDIKFSYKSDLKRDNS